MTSENLITAKVGITLDEAKKILAKARKEKLPIVDDYFTLKGLITIKDIEKQIKYPLSAKDSKGRLLCGAALGITANVLDRVTGAGKCTCRCRCSGLCTRTFCKRSELCSHDQREIPGFAGYRR